VEACGGQEARKYRKHVNREKPKSVKKPQKMRREWWKVVPAVRQITQPAAERIFVINSGG